RKGLVNWGLATLCAVCGCAGDQAMEDGTTSSSDTGLTQSMAEGYAELLAANTLDRAQLTAGGVSAAVADKLIAFRTSDPSQCGFNRPPLIESVEPPPNNDDRCHPTLRHVADPQPADLQALLALGKSRGLVPRVFLPLQGQDNSLLGVPPILDHDDLFLFQI